MKKAIIIMGCSGSGKSTLAKKLVTEFYEQYRKFEYDHGEGDDLGDQISLAKHLETDNYWFRPDGRYDWNHKLIGEAHVWNQQQFKNCLHLQHDYENLLLIVSNTSLTRAERRPYIQAALKAGFEIEVLTPATPWAKDPEECAKRNTHNVPLETIKRMMAKMEPFSPEELNLN